MTFLKRISLLLIAIAYHCEGRASSDVETVLSTKWGQKVQKDSILVEYPRPQLVRSDWLNLNGEWDYGITHRDRTNTGVFTGKILVPFPIESKLSGVARSVTEQERVWYKRSFSLPPAWVGKRVLLHLDAVDWETRVWLNGRDVGTHQGGYDRFTVNITDALNAEGPQELVISAFDPTEGKYQPRGKQRRSHLGGQRLAASGIWQTVWLEPVQEVSVESLQLIPDPDQSRLEVVIGLRGNGEGLQLEMIALEGGKEIARSKVPFNQSSKLAIPKPKLWSPESPFLYDLKINLWKEERKVDEVSSYFGMRKISIGRESKTGVPVLYLNGREYFHLGVLDQGYWPEGIYTAPSDEALRNDVASMKKFGFNLCRKEGKIEPDRWYYWCDKLGILVWQEMPAGDRTPRYPEKEIQRSAGSASVFEAELQAMLYGRGNHPCITGWIPFGDPVGRFETPRVLGLVKTLDSNRLVISDGGPDLGVADVTLVRTPARQLLNKPLVIDGYGDFRAIVPGHVWATNSPRSGMGKTYSLQELARNYRVKMGELTVPSFRRFSGIVFHQFTDVGGDFNGLMTLDRVPKVDADEFALPTRKLVIHAGE